MACQFHINKTILERESETELSLITLCSSLPLFPRCILGFSLSACLSVCLTHTLRSFSFVFILQDYRSDGSPAPRAGRQCRSCWNLKWTGKRSWPCGLWFPGLQGTWSSHGPPSSRYKLIKVWMRCNALKHAFECPSQEYRGNWVSQRRLRLVPQSLGPGAGHRCGKGHLVQEGETHPQTGGCGWRSPW